MRPAPARPPHPRRRLRRALRLAGLLAAACAAPAPAASAHEVVVQDDAQLLHRDTGEVRATLIGIRQLGADTIRLTAGWSAVAPAPAARRRPRFDARDPREYDPAGMARLDRAVRLAHAAGLRVQIDLAFWAPRWAVAAGLRDSTRQRERPDPRRYADFVAAMARRYGGEAHDAEGRRLPRVRRWTTWNEPNHPGFLLPQSVRIGERWVPVAPHHYRAMHEAAHRELKRASPANEVLIGGLASKGADSPGERAGLRPLEFLRELACVDARLEPITDSRCAGFRPLQADGFAYHPYTFGTTPDGLLSHPDEVGLVDLDRLSALLAALQARGRIASALPIHLTEYGYETDPPDRRRGVNRRAQARYLGLAAYLAHLRPDVRTFPQFLIRDIGPDERFPKGSSARYRDYQTGIFDFARRPKPGVDGFRLPFWVRTVGAEARIFGQVRPGRGRPPARIEMQIPGGPWRAVETRPEADPLGAPQVRFATDADGFFQRRLLVPGPVRLRARWMQGTRRGPTSTDLRVVPVP